MSNRDFRSVSDLLQERIDVLQAIQKMQPDLPRFHRQCCGIYLTADVFNTHRCIHACKDRRECEAKRQRFHDSYPNGREV